MEKGQKEKELKNLKNVFLGEIHISLCIIIHTTPKWVSLPYVHVKSKICMGKTGR